MYPAVVLRVPVGRSCQHSTARELGKTAIIIVYRTCQHSTARELGKTESLFCTESSPPSLAMNNNNNDRTERRNWRVFTLSSVCCEMSPACTLKWHGRGAEHPIILALKGSIRFWANVKNSTLNSDTGFERDSDRIFHPQFYFRYSKHLLKLYKRIQRLTDGIHQSVRALDSRQYLAASARLAAMAATRSETS